MKHGISYEDIISIDNLLDAWREFKKGKRKKHDVQVFERQLLHNVYTLHTDLVQKTYTHGGYYGFKISDPKQRDIHKASVRDRLLHHALYRHLHPFFDRTFISDSYSCRKGKGVHKAINRFRRYAWKVSQNHTRTCWVLKCDVRKFFASIDQQILITILKRYIADADILLFLTQVIESFQSDKLGQGLPLGNVTSQLLVNIYMNEFDQFIKHTLKERYYIRYADDFVIFSRNREHLMHLVSRVQSFLQERLQLTLHPRKISITTISSGVDFLGWTHFPDHRVLRTVTKKRMIRNLELVCSRATIASYKGMLQHGNSRKLQHHPKLCYLR